VLGVNGAPLAWRGCLNFGTCPPVVLFFFRCWAYSPPGRWILRPNVFPPPPPLSPFFFRLPPFFPPRRSSVNKTFPPPPSPSRARFFFFRVFLAFPIVSLLHRALFFPGLSLCLRGSAEGAPPLPCFSPRFSADSKGNSAPRRSFPPQTPPSPIWARCFAWPLPWSPWNLGRYVLCQLGGSPLKRYSPPLRCFPRFWLANPFFFLPSFVLTPDGVLP